MDAVLLFLHAWLRWLLLLLLLIALYRAFQRRSDPQWYPFDQRVIQWIAIIATIQLLLGVTLYLFFSPSVSHALANPAVAMRTSHLRFWMVEHPTMMLLVIGIAHWQRAKVQRYEDATAKRKTIRLWSGIMVILLLAGTPFPWTASPRPLFHSLPLP